MVTINLSGPERRRSRTRRRYRPEEARPATLSTRRMLREARGPVEAAPAARTRELLRIIDDERPKTRAACRDGPRPCLYVSCRFHLYLEVNEATGSIKLNHPDREPWELEESCALDIAERGGLTHEEIGRVLNVTRERARQMEEAGLQKLKREL